MLYYRCIGGYFAIVIFANELYYIDRVRAVFRPSLELAL